jgi:8-hydroxy-5-deazaflavin:NADPH oxidoreductase
MAAQLQDKPARKSKATNKGDESMKVGFIGAGSVAGTFGRHLMNAGHTVIVSNSRGPETLAGFVADLGPGAIAGTKQEAAEGDVVILATHWVSVPEALKGVDWHGRILVDATNAHIDPKPDISLEGVTRSRAALKAKGRASSEIVAELAVGARVVKALSNMPMAWIRDFSASKPRTVIFTSGDDSEAKRTVMELINSTGLVAIDLGQLAMGDAMHDVGGPLSGIEFTFGRRLR